jgi:hypothetical protein
MRVGDSQMPKAIRYGEMAGGSRATDRPLLRFKDACKRDLGNMDIDVDSLQEVAADRGAWRQAVYTTLEAKWTRTDIYRRAKASSTLPQLHCLHARDVKGAVTRGSSCAVVQSQQALSLSEIIWAHPLPCETERSHW